MQQHYCAVTAAASLVASSTGQNHCTNHQGQQSGISNYHADQVGHHPNTTEGSVDLAWIDTAAAALLSRTPTDAIGLHCDDVLRGCKGSTDRCSHEKSCHCHDCCTCDSDAPCKHTRDCDMTIVLPHKLFVGDTVLLQELVTLCY